MLVAVLWRCTWGRGREGAMVPASLSTRFQSFTRLPTIKLGPSGAGSRVGGLVHALGPCGSLQWPLLWGWESLLLPPQPPRMVSIRGLRLYFPALEPWVSIPRRLPDLSMRECGAAGSASGQTACPVGTTLRQSRSRHGHSSPLCPGCPSSPLLPVWMNVSVLSSCCQTSLPFNFLSVLVVRGGSVCLPTPPSWFSLIFIHYIIFSTSYNLGKIKLRSLF